MSTYTQPRVIENRSAVRDVVRAAQADGKRVGVVMTMGALHTGHLSLVEQCVAECDLTIVTIFVNPTQFLPGEDFQKYPRELEADIALLQTVGTDIVFAPKTTEMYPEGASTAIRPPIVAAPLEGAHRAGHYEGVCTIVCKLLNAIPADRAYFGSKDYQQYLVIKAMAADLDIVTEIIPCPIIRDEDGLAMSSRNRYLSPEERTKATSLSRGLTKAATALIAGETDAQQLAVIVRSEMEESGISRIDYVAIVDANTLQPISHVSDDAIALVAAHVGDTRLIDNLRLETKSADGPPAPDGDESQT